VPPFLEDYALRVSPRGEVVQELSLLEALFRSGYGHVLWKSRAPQTGDVTHLNDLEPLGTGAAASHPRFRAGDLLASLRLIDAVLVLDPARGEVKWLETRPFLEQHDPDFLPDGWIAVLDNRNDGSGSGAHLRGSRIVAVKPGTDETRVLYPRSGSPPFYTQYSGALQRLSNGNLLITESAAGRVFETDGAGRIVWEWVQEPYDAERVAEVMEGTRYELTPEQVSSWPCRAAAVADSEGTGE
jgi:hypothetical protein